MRLTNDGLKNLVMSLPQPSSLGFGGTDLTDEGVKHLTALPKLGGLLNLNYNNLTDASLEHLKQVKASAYNLTGTKITANGIDELHKTRPNATINWDGGTIESEAKADGAKPERTDEKKP